jgi:hypothetical protein
LETFGGGARLATAGKRDDYNGNDWGFQVQAIAVAAGGLRLCGNVDAIEI